MSKRRRRPRLAVVGVAAVVMLLWAMLSGPGVPAVADDEPGESAPSDTGASPGGAAANSEAENAKVADALQLIETDRLEGFLHRVREATASSHLGAAWTAMRGAEALELKTPELDVRRVQQRRAFDIARAEQIAELAEWVVAGRVVEARQRLRAMRDPVHPQVERAVEACTAERGWSPWTPDRPAPAEELARPEPLRAGQGVRLLFRDEWVRGRVAATARRGASGQDEVAVEVRTANGPALAFVARWELEPVPPAVAVAAEQALVAWQHGDVTLASMWASYCAAAGGAGEPRVARVLAELAAR